MINDITWTELQQAEDMAYFRADLCLFSPESYTLEELHAKGINNSIIHEDFMIGTADLSITARTRDGREVKIFENGDWAF